MGIIHSLYTQSFPPEPTWGVDDIPDLTGCVAIVTGGNAGIGKETVKALLEKNAKVYLAARSPNKAKAAIDELESATGKQAVFLKLDLADLKAMKTTVEEFTSKESQLHVLFNSGGVMFPPLEQLTADGYDLQWGTNVLGHFYLTKLLLPTLLSTVKDSPDGYVRVVNTASMGSHFTNTIDFNSFRDGPARKRRGRQALYFQSKLGNVVFSYELARRYGDQGLISTALNPGNLNTDLYRHVSFIERAVAKFVLYPPAYGALTQLWAGTSPNALNANGKYFIPWAREAPGNQVAKDEKLGQELWSWLEEQVKNL